MRLVLFWSRPIPIICPKLPKLQQKGILCLSICPFSIAIFSCSKGCRGAAGDYPSCQGYTMDKPFLIMCDRDEYDCCARCTHVTFELWASSRYLFIHPFALSSAQGHRNLLPHIHVFGPWEEPREPRENLRRHRKNTQNSAVSPSFTILIFSSLCFPVESLSVYLLSYWLLNTNLG